MPRNMPPSQVRSASPCQDIRIRSEVGSGEMGKDLLYWASALLNLSKKGLENRDVVKGGRNETLFLSHLQKLIDSKITNADHMINKFSINEDLSELYDK